MKKPAICRMVPHGEARDRHPLIATYIRKLQPPPWRCSTTTRSQQESGGCKKRTGNDGNDTLNGGSDNGKITARIREIETVHRAVKELLSNGVITGYIRELQAEHRQLRNGPITVRMTG